MQPGLLLPPGTRLIHIGPHKTGSTVLQAAMHERRDALAAAGVAYAGRGARARKAGWALGLRRLNRDTRGNGMEHWQALVADVENAGDRRVCISNEAFGSAEPDQIRTIVTDLGGAAPHVVAVARGLSGYLPSQWQERVKAGLAMPYDEWLQEVLADPDRDVCLDPHAPEFSRERYNVWYAHDTGALVRRWTQIVGADNFTLIISDDADRGLLPRTFETMLGLPADTLTPPPTRSNTSLPWEQVELIRAVNQALVDAGLDDSTRRDLVARGAVPALTSLERTASSHAPQPEWASPLLATWGQRRVEGLRESGIRIVGEVERLCANAPAHEAPAPDRVELQAAAAAIAAVVRKAASSRACDPGL